MKTPSAEQLEALRRLDTCTVANAIDTFDVRLRNEGFTDSTIRCLFPRLAPMVGHAVTVKIRCSSPPVDGHAYLDRTDWWDYILTVPGPARGGAWRTWTAAREPARFWARCIANILTALGCVGAVTNGAVRDLPAVEAMRFHFFAGKRGGVACLCRISSKLAARWKSAD